MEFKYLYAFRVYFNPTLVRFEQQSRSAGMRPEKNFNPTLVRFEPGKGGRWITINLKFQSYLSPI